MTESLAPRLRCLPVARLLGGEIPVASNLRSRFLGLSYLDRARAGRGLLIPRCASVHTFGMRFALDVYFLGDAGELLAARPRTPARRVVSCRGAGMALEIPAAEGGEFFSPGA
jgi:uncharacterized membrane protein (UPF0127 family)